MSAPAEALAGTTAPAAARGEIGPARHVRYFYFIRTVTVLGGLGVSLAYVLHVGSFDAYHALIFALGVLYPHVSYFLEAKLELGRRVEHATLIVDAFVGGSIVYMLGFSPLPSVALVLITLINPVAFTGFSMIAWTTLSLVLAIAVPWWIRGPNLASGSFPLIDMAAVVYLFAYYLLFAHAVYLRTIALQKSRRELRQQGITIEIEKKRSDALLLSILPPRAAAEFEKSGAVAPRRADRGALLVVTLPELVERFHGDAARALDEAGQLCKAFDAICARHGLDGMKALGHAYLAAAGLESETGNAAAAAIGAAREISQYLREVNLGHAARNAAPLECRVVVHAGPLFAGVVETRKASYEIVGPTLVELLAFAARAPAGRACASARACEAAQVAGEPLGGTLRTVELAEHA